MRGDDPGVAEPLLPAVAVGHGAWGSRGGKRCVGALTVGQEEVGVIDRQLSGRAWIRSSYSGNTGGECVELAVAETHVLVRDSKWSHGSVLAFRRAVWCGFLAELVNPQAGGS